MADDDIISQSQKKTNLVQITFTKVKDQSDYTNSQKILDVFTKDALHYVAFYEISSVFQRNGQKNKIDIT